MQINCLSRDLKYAAGQNLTIAIVHNCRPTYLPLFTSSNKGGGKCVCPRLLVCLLARLLKKTGWIWMKFCMSTDVGTWTNWLTFESDPDHNPDPVTGLTPDFWILAGYLNKLWTDFDGVLWVDSWGGLTFWAGSGWESGSRIRTCIQNCKADIAKSNGRV